MPIHILANKDSFAKKSLFEQRLISLYCCTTSKTCTMAFKCVRFVPPKSYHALAKRYVQFCLWKKGTTDR